MHAVFLGRFQPFHLGHLGVVEMLVAQKHQITIVIGSANLSRLRENPWTWQERKTCIEKSIAHLAHYNITIIPLDDILDDDQAWLMNMQNTIGNFDDIFSGNPWVWEVCTKYGIPYEKIQIMHNISGTLIRQNIASKKDFSGYLNYELDQELIEIYDTL